MIFDGSMKGKWLGRMIDVRGFEGNIVFNLRHNKKSGGISGICVATIGTNHASSEFRGEIKGGLGKEGLQLAATAGKEQSIVILLKGKPAALREGGVGLTGTYAVTGRGFSPLRGGVICATLNKPITSVAMESEVTINPVTGKSKSSSNKKRRRAS